MRKICCTLIFLAWQVMGWSNSLNLFNNTDNTLKAIILDADGVVLSEVILNPRDGSTWSDNQDQYGYEYDPTGPQTPYTVNWYCMAGQPFGSCSNVSPGAVILAQGCAGAQECPQNPTDEAVDITPSP